MRKSTDPLGALLVAEGVLTERQRTDVLDQQREGFAFASLVYLLGYADEETLVRSLSRQMGTPGVLLELSIVSLHNLRDVPEEIARRYTLLPLYQDRQHVYVGVADRMEADVLSELSIITGRTVIPHVALQVCLARAIRDCYRLLEVGDAYWFGDRTGIEDLNDSAGVLTPVLDVDELPPEVEAAPLDVTDPNLAVPVNPEDIVSAQETASGEAGEAGGEDEDEELELDGEGRAPLPPPRRILVVDSDERARGQAADLLEPEGHTVVQASTGLDAVREIRQQAPDLLLIEMILPEIQGYQLCRRIKSSRRYGDIPVVLVTGSETSRERSRDLVERYGADDVVSKPFQHAGLLGAVNHLLARPRSLRPAADADRAPFEAAIEHYKAGRAQQAVEALQEALQIDPLSARSHFVLGNILQHQDRRYEAIDAYEQTAQLRPDYFPALSRLAFLYYRTGHTQRALDTWRRSLAHCEDPQQRARIEAFMEKLAEEAAKRRAGLGDEATPPGSR